MKAPASESSKVASGHMECQFPEYVQGMMLRPEQFAAVCMLMYAGSPPRSCTGSSLHGAQPQKVV